MISWPNFVSQLFNGLATGALLALISAGLTIIYGTLGVLNLAHGAMFMLGGYAGYVAYDADRLVLVAVIAGALFVLVVGLLLEWIVIRHFYGRPRGRPDPAHLRHRHRHRRTGAAGASAACRSTCRRHLGGRHHAAGLHDLSDLSHRGDGDRRGDAAVLYLVLYRTRLGMVVRAGIEDADHGRHPRHQRLSRVPGGVRDRRDGGRVAGIVNAPVVSLTPDIGDAILVQTFVVVVIGGVGSFPGAIVGGLISGEILSLTSMVNPSYSEVMLFAAMTVVLWCARRACWACGAASEHAQPDAAAPSRCWSTVLASGLMLAPFALPPIGFERRYARSDPGLGIVRDRLRSAVRLHRPAFVRPVGGLRHRRVHCRLPADQQPDPERAAGAADRHRWARPSSASRSARSRCAAPAFISR